MLFHGLDMGLEGKAQLNWRFYVEDVYADVSFTQLNLEDWDLRPSRFWRRRGLRGRRVPEAD